jgi:hypothetical protein
MNSICGGAPLKACPARQIVANAGVEGSVVVGKILENKSHTFGFDAQTEQYVAIPTSITRFTANRQNRSYCLQRNCNEHGANFLAHKEATC